MLGILLAFRTGKELGLLLLGYSISVWNVSSYCATGGGSRGGGVHGPLGTTVPWGVAPKVQGGPWAPPPCVENSSETFMVCALVSLLGTFGFVLGFPGWCCLWGKDLVWVGALRS